MAYHLTGVLSTLLYTLSVYGLWVQLQLIWKRKSSKSSDDIQLQSPTASISINFSLMAFLAYFLLFFYGFSLERFNHYLVWPRLLAMVLTLLILWEIFSDRREKSSFISLLFAVSTTLCGVVALVFYRDFAIALAVFPQALLVLIALAMGQGNVHQILLIYKSGSTGGVALRSHQLTFVKDIGTVLFGFAMGFSSGWPLVLLCGSNALFKLVIMYLFRWVRVSEQASLRRACSNC